MKEFQHDRWSALSHIPELGEGCNARPPGKTWVVQDDWRRLTAYRVLAAYKENVRRYWLPQAMWQRPVVSSTTGETLETGRAEAEKWREYGHAGLLIDTARSLVLGSDQTVVVTDGEDAAAGAQEYLSAWAEKEQLKAQLIVSEENSIGAGDGVLTLTWSEAKGRPRLQVYDPGFYFPDLLSVDNTPGWEEDFPPIVHLGWEWTDDEGIVYLRQSTWRMVRLDINGGPMVPNAPVTAPWGGKRAWTCLYSVTDYRLDHLRGDKISIYQLEPTNSAATPVTPTVDLELDFMPVVHVPNTPPGDYHYGVSLLQRMAQVLDDLAGSDTDISVTASESAAPPAVFTGAGDAQPMPGGPAASWWGPEGAGMGYADTSKVLVAGLQQNRNLLDNLAINSRLGVALLGRVTPKDVPSGFALQLGFAPAAALMREMRLVRDAKYSLLLKMVLRMAQAHRVLPAGSTPVARLDFGSGLPSDIAIVIDSIKALLPIGAMSTETAVRWLQGNGVPVEVAEDEVAAIKAESYEKAVQLVEATGDVDAARKLLGLAAAAPAPVTEVPAPTLPTS